jgi:signal transduction histidine kinase
MFLLLLTVVLTLSGMFYYTEQDSMRSAMYAKQLQIVQNWSMTCAGMPNASGQEVQDESVTRAVCINSAGIIYRSKYPELLGTRTLAPKSDRFNKLFERGIWTDENLYETVITMPTHLAKAGQAIAMLTFSRGLLVRGINDRMRTVFARIYIISAIALALGSIGILLIVRMMLSPLQTISEGARAIGSGKLDYRIHVGGSDEIAQLAGEFNQMAVKLSALDEMKNDFVSAISHDLRSPVTGIKISASNIAEELHNKAYDKLPEQLFLISEHADRLNRFIDSLLEVSRIESGKQTLSLRDMNLEEIADRVVRYFAFYAKQKNIALNLVVESRIDDMQGDSEKIEQILSNLVGNSLKFTDAGFVTMYVRQKTDSQELRVEDTGRGITPEEYKVIFEKFHPTKNSRHGTGLGLYITKNLVELHGGTIKCSSIPGKGSIFTVDFPVHKKHEYKKENTDT